MLEILKTRSGELQTGAALVTAVFALIALVVAVIQIFSSNASAAQNRAQEAYRDYLNLCIEHPELSSYLAYSKNKKSSSSEEYNDLDEKYQWFVSVLLHTGEQILEDVSSDGAWRATVERQLVYHRPELLRIWPLYEDNFDGPMKELVDHVVSPDFEKKEIDDTLIDGAARPGRS